MKKPEAASMAEFISLSILLPDNRRAQCRQLRFSEFYETALRPLAK